MIKIINTSCEKPYKEFFRIYEKALEKKQPLIHAINISSYDIKNHEVESRMVNLKYIDEDKWTFFSNYNSPKAEQFRQHNQISAIFHWDSIKTQIRIKANIEMTDPEFSNKHFNQRSDEKNALSISSMQSQKIDSYKSIEKNYEKVFQDHDLLVNRPEYWGGFTFVPYYFEFWKGHKNRINKRQIYKKVEESWEYFILQP